MQQMADPLKPWPPNISLVSEAGGNFLWNRMQELKRWQEEQKQRLQKMQNLQLQQLAQGDNNSLQTAPTWNDYSQGPKNIDLDKVLSPSPSQKPLFMPADPSETTKQGIESQEQNGPHLSHPSHSHASSSELRSSSLTGNTDKSFEELLFQKLKEQKEDNYTVQAPSINKPKKPFLRKGQGLARFNPKKQARNEKSSSSTNDKKDTLSYQTRNAKPLCTTLRLKPPAIAASEFDLNPPLPPTASTSEVGLNLDSSFLRNMEELETKHKEEQEELAEFEKLETFAHNTSFASEDQHANTLLPKNSDSTSGNTRPKRLYNDPLPYPEPESSDPTSSRSEANIQTLLESLRTRKLLLEQRQKISPYSCAEESDTSIEECSWVVEIPDYHKEDYLIPEVCENDPQEGGTECPKKRVSFKENISWRTLSMDESSLEEPDNLSIPEHLKDNDDHFINIEEDQISRPFSSEITDKASRLLSEKSQGEREPPYSKLNLAANTESSEPTPATLEGDRSLLLNRIQELECEIVTFREERDSLQKLRKQAEETLKQLQKEKLDFEKYKEEAKKKLEAEMQEERKQLRRERESHERVLKLKSNQPNKQDKELITSLRQQNEKLQEEYKKQEVKWTQEVKRLKTRLTLADREKDALKANIEGLQSQRTELLTMVKEKQEALLQTSKKKLVLKDSEVQVQPTLRSQTSQTPPLPPAPVLVKHLPPPNSLPKGALSSKDNAISKTPIVEKEPQPSAPYKEVAKDGVIERIYKNGERELLYPNNTSKRIGADGITMTITFYNGDKKQILPDMTEIYHFAGSGAICTTYPDGLKVTKFADGQEEKLRPNGTKIISHPDGTLRTLFPDGSEESTTPEGNAIHLAADGSQTLTLPNGEKEIRTKEYMRREFPDGSSKTVYPDGRVESHYKNGRVRVKDKYGAIILDIKPPS